MKKAIIWKESIYDAGFVCPQCQSVLAKEGRPINGALVSAKEVDGEILLCSECGTTVAKVRDYDGPLEPGMKGGLWSGK